MSGSEPDLSTSVHVSTDQTNMQGNVQSTGDGAGVTDMDLDLEQPVLITGTEWADAVERQDKEQLDDEKSANEAQEEESWEAVANHKTARLVASRAKVDEAQDFVIPIQEGSLGAGNDTGHVSGSGPGHGANRGWGGGLVRGGATFSSAVFPDIHGQELQHKSLVEPIFLAYKRVSSGVGEWITLMQIACSVVEALNDNVAVDVVQPMKTGWWIYVRTQADRERLVAQGLTIAGKHIQLRSEMHVSQKRTVKVTVRD